MKPQLLVRDLWNQFQAKEWDNSNLWPEGKESRKGLWMGMRGTIDKSTLSGIFPCDREDRAR